MRSGELSQSASLSVASSCETDWLARQLHSKSCRPSFLSCGMLVGRVLCRVLCCTAVYTRLLATQVCEFAHLPSVVICRIVELPAWQGSLKCVEHTASCLQLCRGLSVCLLLLALCSHWLRGFVLPHWGPVGRQCIAVACVSVLAALKERQGAGCSHRLLQRVNSTLCVW